MSKKETLSNPRKKQVHSVVLVVVVVIVVVVVSLIIFFERSVSSARSYQLPKFETKFVSFLFFSKERKQ